MTYEATLTSKGQVTIPAEVRAKLKLKEGDKIEFYFDLRERLVVRPRNLSPTAVFENAPKRKKPLKARTMTDDEAIAAAIAEKDRRSRRRRAA